MGLYFFLQLNTLDHQKEFFKILICKNFLLFLYVIYANLLLNHVYIQSN